MRRLILSVSVVMMGLILGCQDNKPKAEPLQSSSMDTNSLQPDLYATDSGSSYTTPSSGAPATYDYSDTSGAAALTGGNMHTVAKGDTLYGLARKYYGNQSKWKDIYEANRSVISNPNQLKVGQQLTIP